MFQYPNGFRATILIGYGYWAFDSQRINSMSFPGLPFRFNRIEVRHTLSFRKQKIDQQTTASE